MSSLGADDLTAEVLARLNRLELRLDGVEALVAPGENYGLAPSRGGPARPSSTVYADLGSWVTEHFIQTYSRPLGGEWRWCPWWSEHPEAVIRLEALWHSWEALRTDPDLGMATWLRDHLDPQLTVLLSARGPFARCSVSRHEEHAALPVGEGWAGAAKRSLASSGP